MNLSLNLSFHLYSYLVLISYHFAFILLIYFLVSGLFIKMCGPEKTISND